MSTPKFSTSRTVKSTWTPNSDSPGLSRFSGSAWPHITYIPDAKKIVARNNNGPHPSKSVSTTNLTIEGLKQEILPHISKPWPTDQDLTTFLQRFV